MGVLRDLQDRIQERILRSLHFPSYLHGGVPGRSTVTNAQAHLGQKVVVTADVKNFFPSITHDQVFRVWRHTLGCSPRISQLLTQLTTYCGRLPQGAPTSTSMANLVMHNVGSEVHKASDLLGLTHTTFVDDLTFSGKRAREALNPTVQILRVSGFRLPHRKIKIKSGGDRKAVTGVILGRSKISIPKKKLSKIRSALHHLATETPGSLAWESAHRSTLGLLAYMSAVDAMVAAELRRRLETIESFRKGGNKLRRI